MSNSFTDCLNIFGVNYELQLLDHHQSVWPNRNGQKGTGVILHTEGVPNKIGGKADRNIRDYFNNRNNPNTHGYITFSGKLFLYLPLENGCWGAGNDDDNVQCSQFETQDNGYYSISSTYTLEQYNTWSRVYCAIKLFYKSKYNTDLEFASSKLGWRYHRTIDTNRECPGALDGERIQEMAKLVWNEKFAIADNLYRIKRSGTQLGAFKEYDNAFEMWYDNKDTQVIYNNRDITFEFTAMANVLETRIKKLEDDNIALTKEFGDLRMKYEESLEVNKTLTRKISSQSIELAKFNEFVKSIWYSLYNLFKPKQKNG